MLQLYNTLTRKKELFAPIKKGIVHMYSCGPTVYDYPHIGNYRAYIVADLLKRYLKYRKFQVKHVMNITDVDDKTIRNSQKQGISLKEFTKKYEDAFFEDIKTLNIEPADIYPRATEHINDMVKVIKILMDKGFAYKGEDNSIYYDVSKFKNYGRLAHIKTKDLKAGARVKQDEYEKEEANDFALWKSYDSEDGNVFWETGIGKGRPGWHIECSTMSAKYLGETFDIHTGGVDLVFPHHENEIAQSEAATGSRFVNYWVHNEWLVIDGKKMSKSLGNFYTLMDVLSKNYDAMAVRYLLLATHYKKKLNFTFKGLEAAKAAVERLNEFVANLKEANGEENPNVKRIAERAKTDFEFAMDDDLHISEALAAVFELVKKVNVLLGKNRIGKKNAGDILDFIKRVNSVVGIIKDERKEELDSGIKALIKVRDNARKNRNYAESDRIREELRKKGILLDDTKEGTRWKKIK